MKKILKRDTNIFLKIVNGTSQLQPVTLFGVQAQQQSTPGSTVYSWDFTNGLAAASLFTANTVYVIARPNSPLSTFAPYFTLSGISSITDILNILNSLGIGTFVNPSGNIITTDNPDYIFSSISITQGYYANSILLPAGSAGEFASLGSLIYDPGYSLGLIGNCARINPANAFWINAGMTDTDGPFNRNMCSVSFDIHSPHPLVKTDQQVGFWTQVNAPSTKTYYIGFSAFNDAALYINGVQVVKLFDTDITASNANILAKTGLVSPQALSLDPFWYIIPVTLQAGVNIIQFLAAHNGSTTSYSAAMEVYDNTAAQIAAATSYAGLNLLFGSVSVQYGNLY